MNDRVISFVMTILFFLSGIVFWLAIHIRCVKALTKASARMVDLPRLKRKAFKNYLPGEHDVLVCTHSKSGTNWAMQIVTQITCYGEAEFNHIHDVVPWVEAQLLTYVVKLNEPTFENSSVGLRAVKTHMESDFVPYNETAKYLTVIRDPKDVVVSAYRFILSLMPMVKGLSIDDFIDLYITGSTIFGSWSHHTGSYWAWHNRPNVLILFYADMKKDLDASVRRIADLMHVDLTEEQLKKIVHKSSFTYMQGIDHKFAPDIPGLTRNSKDPVMVRSGKSGSAREFLSPSQIQKIDQAMIEQLHHLDSNFPYAQHFISRGHTDGDLPGSQPI